jgi:hypothetical protein
MSSDSYKERSWRFPPEVNLALSVSNSPLGRNFSLRNQKEGMILVPLGIVWSLMGTISAAILAIPR